MRKVQFAPEEHYHIFNRGNNKQPIFQNNKDRIRFLFLLLHNQAPVHFINLSRQVSYFVKHRVFNISDAEVNKIATKRYVELENFVLMPNHFHMTVFEKEEGGISRYMQRILNGYTKYFNTKYQKVGHLFQGPFKAVHVEDNRQLLYLSAYIHRNPRELQDWNNKEISFPWSSYQDYAEKNRWGNLLKSEVILSQFSDKTEYKNFVETSGAKEMNKELEIDC
ncbi:MAG: hypothetical protein UX07_C0014G0012 [Parcubacteria group bacterium GW2011_GWA2_45_30]|nr:MAG: hypothetical protein UX07_C0014G0012 [Parcubacteria group bacterium GW2011_GWA2_45_30]